MDKDTALKLALEAFEWNYNTDLDNIPACEKWAKMLKENIAAIKEALAQPEQEPVCVAFIRTYVGKDKDGIEIWKEDPLYTTSPQRKPLTDEQLIAAYESEQQGRWGDHIRSLRAIEAAHGIKGE